MFVIGYKFNNEIFSREVEDWKNIARWLRTRGCEILYVYYKENNKPVFVYKGD